MNHFRIDIVNSSRLYSIIVPVYNAEKTLHRCVDSILGQTYKNFELILVDDGSTDNSGKIIDEYASSDSRVRPIHKNNGGVSSARNVGLKIAGGEYIIFVDSDDKFAEKSFLEECLDIEADIIITGYTSDGMEYCPIAYDAQTKQQIVMSLNNNFNELYVRTPWAKIFSNKLIRDNHIVFDESLRLGEDTYFVLNAFGQSTSVKYIPKSYYCYTSAVNHLSKFQIDCLTYRQSVNKFEQLLNKITPPNLLNSLIGCEDCLKSVFWDAFVSNLQMLGFGQRLKESFIWLKDGMWKILPLRYKGLWKVKQILKIMLFPFYHRTQNL